MKLEEFPRVSLAHLPTAIEHLPRLSRHLGGVDVYVKRDDCTGLAMGGNKTRKLEFQMAHAIACGANVVIMTGGVQSNYCRQTAAAAARLGLGCHLVLSRSIDTDSENFTSSGNRLLDDLLGATCHVIDRSEDVEAKVEEVKGTLLSDGFKPHSLISRKSRAASYLGYFAAAKEMHEQMHSLELTFDTIVVAIGGGGTYSGLVAGLRGVGSPSRVLGFTVADTDPQEVNDRVRSQMADVSRLLGAAVPVDPIDDLVIDRQFESHQYGIARETSLDAMRLLASLEGLVLDPIYSAVAMAGLIGWVREGRISPREKVLFIHTGGAPGLFGYRDQLTGVTKS